MSKPLLDDCARRVVIVSRSVTMLRTLRRCFFDVGIRVNLAESDERALELARLPKPVLVLISEMLCRPESVKALETHFGCPVLKMDRRRDRSQLRSIARAVRRYGCGAARYHCSLSVLSEPGQDRV